MESEVRGKEPKDGFGDGFHGACSHEFSFHPSWDTMVLKPLLLNFCYLTHNLVMRYKCPSCLTHAQYNTKSQEIFLEGGSFWLSLSGPSLLPFHCSPTQRMWLSRSPTAVNEHAAAHGRSSGYGGATPCNFQPPCHYNKHHYVASLAA